MVSKKTIMTIGFVFLILASAITLYGLANLIYSIPTIPPLTPTDVATYTFYIGIVFLIIGVILVAMFYFDKE